MSRKKTLLCLAAAMALVACDSLKMDNNLNQVAGLQDVKAAPEPPDAFPQRIWAACDFELGRKDVTWLGQVESSAILSYPGNRAAGRAVQLADGPQKILCIQPAYYPRMGGKDFIYFRYFLKGTTSIDLQLLIRDKNFCGQSRLTGLTEGIWSEATVDLGRVTGTPGDSIVEGERMDGLVMTIHPEHQGAGCELIVDDIICFSDDQLAEPLSGEPFPERVICLWGFDVLDYYHPWTHRDYWVLREGEMVGNDWGVAQALPRENRPGKQVRLIIDPPQQVGAETRLRFRYFLKGTSSFQVQIFDLTDGDNRHIILKDIEEGRWRFAELDFTRDGIKNDGDQTLFRAGNLVDDIFFFPLDAGEDAELLIDDVVLYDAGGS
jgi:hypothetical protein